MTVRDPGWGMSEKQIDDFYARWREWMVVASLRGVVVCANPKHSGIFADLQDRLAEDPWWKIRQLEPVPMLFKPEIPEDDLLFWQDGNLMTPADFLGNKGFGRMNAKAPTREGITPWSAAEVPDDIRELTPDPEPTDDS